MINEKDVEIGRLRKDIAKWKNRAVEACGKACFNCEEYMSKDKALCAVCRITKIKEEAMESDGGNR